MHNHIVKALLVAIDVAPRRAQAAYVSIKEIRNGRRKRHGGASTGPTNQTFGKSHHRYVHGLRTKEVIAIRKLAAQINKSMTDLSEQV